MDYLTTIIPSLAILAIGNILFVLVTKRAQSSEDRALQDIKDELKIFDPSGQRAFLIDWKKKKPRKSMLQANIFFTGLMLFLMLGAYKDPTFPVGCALMMCVAPLLFFLLHYAHNIVIIRPDRIEGKYVNRRRGPKVIEWTNIEKITSSGGDVPGLNLEGGDVRIYVPSFYTNYDRFLGLLKERYPEQMVNFKGEMVLKTPILSEPTFKTDGIQILGLVLAIAGLFIPMLVGIAVGRGDEDIPLMATAIMLISGGGWLLVFWAGSLDTRQRRNKVDRISAKREYNILRGFAVVLLIVLVVTVLLELEGIMA